MAYSVEAREHTRLIVGIATVEQLGSMISACLRLLSSQYSSVLGGEA